MLSLLALSATAFNAPALQPGTVSRSSTASMQLNKKVLSFDQDGIFEGREIAVQKPPVRLLERVEELKVLTSVADAGLLSAAEDAGVFSKLEAAGAFSSAEKLLPLADDLKLLSTAEALLNVPANLLFFAAVALLLGETALITVVPDDNAAFVALQLATGLAAGAGSVVLVGSAFLFSLLQGEV